jgi:flagellin-like hook-associated protein FlgL
MPVIAAIPTNRVSDLLVRQRMLSQLMIDQNDLFRIQTQISTGQRIILPSEDAPAATRAIGLQDLIERKLQTQTNLGTSQSYLNATDSALANVSGILTDIRGQVLSVVGDTASDEQRQAVISTIEHSIDQLVDVGNHQFRGRYLFGGTRSEPPFARDTRYVRYNGNEQNLSSYADIDLLFETNVHGNEVFGAISEPVRGTADLTPALTSNTRVADLRGGAGVELGVIAISDGAHTSRIDLSQAETIGDIVALIESQPPGWDDVPPSGAQLTVEITATGLNVSLTGGAGGITIREVAGGTTAGELGILHDIDTGATSVTGSDLDPRLRLTTPLADILGSRAQVTLNSPGSDNDLVFEATQRGSAYNGVRVQFVDDGLLKPGTGVPPGSETVSYSTTAVAARASLDFNALANNDILVTATSAGTGLNDVTFALDVRPADAGGVLVSYNALAGTYSISVEEGVSTAADVAAAIAADGAAAGPFTAALDTSVDATNDGSYVFTATDANPIVGSTGNSGGNANTLFVFIRPGGTTAEHVVDAVNNDPLVAPLFSARLSEKDTSAASAAGMGDVDVDATGVLSGGGGVEFDQTSGLQIVNGGQTHTIDFAAAVTVEDLLNALNGSTAGVLAQINETGTGIDIRSRISGADFAIGENGGTTATELGLRSLTLATQLADLNHGLGVRTADGDDFTIHRSDGVDLTFDLAAAQTVGDVLDAINNHPANLGPGTRVVARLAAVGNGIELVEDVPAGVRDLQVERNTPSWAAIDLGWINLGQLTSGPPIVTGSGAMVIESGEINPRETAGVFNTLIRLADALATRDLVEIERASAMLGDDLERVNFARAELGNRQQGLDVLKDRTDTEVIELKRVLSDEIDVDLAQAISDLVGRQASLEASLRMSAQTLQLSLLDFL